MNTKTIRELLEEFYNAKYVYFYLGHELCFTAYASGLEEAVMNFVPESVRYSSESLFFYMDGSKDELQVRKWLLR